MNNSIAEVKPASTKMENFVPDDPCSKQSVHPDPAGTLVWAEPPSNVSLCGALPYIQQHPVQPGMMDPLSFSYSRDHCQWQVTDPDCLLYPQSNQYHLLTGPVPGPADSLASSSFTNEAILYSMMPGELQTSVSSVLVPLAMDQQFESRLSVDNPLITRPVLCNMSGGGQVLLMNPCEPGPVYQTLQSAPDHITKGLAQEKDVFTLGTHSQYHQGAYYDSRDQIDNMQPQAPPAPTVGAEGELKSRKPCHCTRSQCLKLYCECFASGVMCSNCDCTNCCNNSEQETKRLNAIKLCLDRNPNAFKPKIASGTSGEVKGWHNKGCNCKRSGCLMNYCECYEANVMCTSSCKCVACRNYDDASETNLSGKTRNDKDKRPAPVITLAVVEAVCGRLLDRAMEAEREDLFPVQAERLVLNNFGRCLSKTVQTMFKNNTN